MTKNEDLKAFERGQVWKNPDDELMMVISVRDADGAQKVEYVTQDGEIGSFYSTNKAIVSNISLTRPTVAPADGDVEMALEYLIMNIVPYGGYIGSDPIKDIEVLRTALQSTRKPFMNHVHACMNGDAEALKGSVGEIGKPPADTIAVPREVLQGVRGALNLFIITHYYDRGNCIDIIEGRAHLASLDAVLAEGE